MYKLNDITTSVRVTLSDMRLRLAMSEVPLESNGRITIAKFRMYNSIEHDDLEFKGLCDIKMVKQHTVERMIE